MVYRRLQKTSIGPAGLPLSRHSQLLLLLLSFLSLSVSAAGPLRYGPPRFKQNARSHQFAYLGDTIRLKCNAVGRPQPKVHWYREGKYLNYSFLAAHPRLKEKGMSLEVRRIEVGDRGNWTCRVWNNEGSTSRNFTLHIVDFCDYFLNVHIHPRRVPEECLCQWAIQQRDSLSAPDIYQLRALPQLRADLDLSELVNNASRCRKYAQVEEIVRLRTHQPRTDKNKTVPSRPAIGTSLPPRPPFAVSSSTSPKWRPSLKNLSAKLQLSQRILQTAKLREEADEEEEEEQEGEEGDERTGTASSSPSPAWSTTTRSTRVPPWLTTRRWPPPQRVAPYFRQLEDRTLTHIVIPAGRTLKLSCKAGGQPEPQVVWRKGNDEILRDTESKTGSLFQLRRWSLELEDATEADSGEYACEVFNSAGSIVRRFQVEVQDRIRSRPILVPNVLVNKTVDVNGTVDFTCQVISDLVPHVVWIKLFKRNGSYLHWDHRAQQHAFNFLDMSSVSRARIFHDNQTNRYRLEIGNVSMDDQGIYSCVAGNTLGMSMANATLTVNEFRTLTLPTEVPISWPLSYTVLFILSFLLLCAFVALGMLYLFFAKKFSAKNRVQTLDKMAVRKKVVITKKPHREGEFWSDLASSYSITVEPVPVLGGGGGKGGRVRTDTGETEGVPLMAGGGQGQPQAEMSLLSDYEVPTDLAWEIERERLQLVDTLGEGAFGEVWRGILSHNGGQGGGEPMPVAVKRLKAAAQEKELIILVSEMQILKSIGQHPNILKLVGCCTGLGPLLVVLELCDHGNLRDFLRKHRPKEEADQAEESVETAEGELLTLYQNVEEGTEEGQPQRQLTLRDLVHFAIQIARGMDFLASKKIIHRDLAARNVLVARDMTMKISDFGLSRNVFYHDYYRKRGAGRLPIKWMAPEALEANVYTVHSDVWSYGILLWEILTLGGTPYPSIAMPQLYNLLKEGYRMEAPHNCPDEIYGVMVSCWQDKPEIRPAFRTIADYFEWMLQEADNLASRSGSSGDENGEAEETTTDEGHYAMIQEGQNGPAERISPQAGAEGVEKQSAEEGAGQRRTRRPQSAPGLVSFEVFSQEMALASTNRAADHHRDQSADMQQQKALCSQNLPPPPRPPERRSLLEQLLQRVVWRGDRAAARVDRERARLLSTDEFSGASAEGTSAEAVIYNNLQPPSSTADDICPSPSYANTIPSSTHSGDLLKCSSTLQRISPRNQQQYSPSGSCHPSQRRPKKSVASEHCLRVQGVFFAGIASQNEKLGGVSHNGTSEGVGSSCSASLGRSPPPVGGTHCQLPFHHNKLLGMDWRQNENVEDSSGHGSAMSSAEGLGGMDFKEEQQQESPPVGQTVDYVSIAPLGQFPRGC